MEASHRNVRSSKGGKKRRRRLPSYLQSDNALLSVFVAAAFIVSITTLIVPWTLEESQPDHFLTTVEYQQHSIATYQQKESVVTKDHLKKKSVGEKSSSTHHQKADAVSNTKNIDGRSNTTEGYFLTHSTPYHTIFSTGCSIFQDWQSYVFFYHVFQSGQEGHVTRIASGCNGEEKSKLQDMFDKEISSMRPDVHHLHQTPDYSFVPKKHKNKFKYFNKPFGVRHWMEHALGYPENHKLHDDSIIILMDPDQVLLRSFTNDFTNSSELWRKEKLRKLKVEHGSPFSQQYGYGMQWYDKVNLDYVFNNSEVPTPLKNMSRNQGFNYYFAMGPPYIATAKDMWSIVNKWSEIAPAVHDEYPYLLAEMFAYNLAIGHLELRHTIAKSFQVSDPRAGGEGFPLIDAVPASNMCKDFPASELPHVIHYCQRYYLGKWFIGKYKLRKDFISCEAPLLMRPPDDIALKYTSAILPGKGELKELNPKHVKEYAFMTCALIDALNSASKYYKDQHCGGNANYNYTYVFHDDMRMPNETTAHLE
mmetsp:Transcript_12848/g.32359  ORF Transcript_12848/g.32359 Transcript_12848/m.32359 type:complete len:534 (-) Transcript_12848:95-1696(-)